MTNPPDCPPLLPVLERHFGFTAFRPCQEAIIRDVLAGRDVLALLATGGGKSLCYQLPAAMDAGVTVVVSPLISLMKNQVDALRATGIPATYVNSSLPREEAERRLADLSRDRFRLVYVAPERLLLPGFLRLLARNRVCRIAVDEAHCVFEWGRDFRPEYRRLKAVRAVAPDAPVLALTSTATEAVRREIVTHLELRAPAIHIGGFDRPNLVYRVVPKSAARRQLASYVLARPGESGIVYFQSRAAAEGAAAHLAAAGVSAVAYHAGLDPDIRSGHQDRFLGGEVRVICATIAFGMGIDKADVRYVVHHDLPQSLDRYHQETGRAGRDGLPADCLLLFRADEAAWRKRCARQTEDPAERANALDRVRQMVRYAKTYGCRRRALLHYFGEAYPNTGCGGCDNCLVFSPARQGRAAIAKVLSEAGRLLRGEVGRNSGG